MDSEDGKEDNIKVNLLLLSTRNPSENNEKDNTTLKNLTCENKISDGRNQKSIKVTW